MLILLCVNVLSIRVTCFMDFLFFVQSLINRDSEVNTKADPISLVAATFLGRHRLFLKNYLEESVVESMVSRYLNQAAGLASSSFLLAHSLPPPRSHVPPLILLNLEPSTLLTFTASPFQLMNTFTGSLIFIIQRREPAPLSLPNPLGTRACSLTSFIQVS